MQTFVATVLLMCTLFVDRVSPAKAQPVRSPQMGCLLPVLPPQTKAAPAPVPARVTKTAAECNEPRQRDHWGIYRVTQVGRRDPHSHDATYLVDAWRFPAIAFDDQCHEIWGDAILERGIVLSYRVLVLFEHAARAGWPAERPFASVADTLRGFLFEVDAGLRPREAFIAKARELEALELEAIRRSARPPP